MQPKSQGLEDPRAALWETPVQPWLGSQIRAVTNSEVISWRHCVQLLAGATWGGGGGNCVLNLNPSWEGGVPV